MAASITLHDGPVRTVFPSDLSDRYYMSLTFSDYARPSFLGTVSLNKQGTVCLPIPSNLVDSQTVGYNASKENTAVGELAYAAMTEKGDGVATVGGDTATSLAWKAIRGGLIEAAGALAKGIGLGSAVQNWVEIGQQGLGYADNPMLSVNLTGPQFRQHSFTWRFAPQSRAESVTLAGIIDAIQLAKAPSIAGLFYRYPSVVVPQLFPSSRFMYDFQPCLIENVTVDYSPQNQPTFYEGGAGAPQQVELKVQMIEIVLITRETFRRGS